MPTGSDEADLMAQVQRLWTAGRIADTVPLLRRAKDASPEHSPWVDYWLASALLQSADEGSRSEGAALAAREVDDSSGGLPETARAALARAVARSLALPAHPSDPELAQAEWWWQRATASSGVADPATGALVRLRQGRFDEAVALARQLEDYPDGALTAAQRATAQTLLGLALVGTGDISEGRRLAGQARHLDPTSALLPELEAHLDSISPAPVPGSPVERSPVTRYRRPTAGQMGGTSLTPVVMVLIALNALVFLLSRFGKASVLDRFGMVPSLAHHEPYRLITSPFFHLNLLHIALNMFTLAIIGSPVEALLGKVRFLALYVISGLGGSIGFYLLAPHDVVGVGASGAIFGLMGAYFVLARRHGFTTTPVALLIVINLVYGFVVAGVGWQAHVGGLVTGIALAAGFGFGRPASRSRRIIYDIGTCVAVLAVLAALLQVPVSSAA